MCWHQRKIWPKYIQYFIYTKYCIHLKLYSYTKPAHTEKKILLKQVLMQQEGQLTYKKKKKVVNYVLYVFLKLRSWKEIANK